ncbi:MAG TPA: hypothetical protein VFP84_08165 [Kofleriaceae bacterium]|nr:hypothetical protein [Kofleriaceae bacterium]
MGSYWFAAAPSRQERTRISLNFGLGRAERLFNERVVPGLGRVWFVRQISWPAAAIALRERLRGTINTKASAISHGLEALGCKLEWGENPDGERILGKRAFDRDADDDIWAFDKLRTTKHYVQNTHRQAASRTIRDEGGLGLASGSRFDRYELTTNGQELADAFLDQPVGRGGGKVGTQLESWVRGGPIDASSTLRHAMAPSSPSDRERELVHARIFGVSGEACERRLHAAQALGHGRDLREMLEVADRLRNAGHVAHADDVVAAHTFGMLLDRARDLATLVSTRVDEAQLGWPLAEVPGDMEIKGVVAALKTIGAQFLKCAETAKFDEAKSRVFARALEKDVEDVVAYVARATSEVFSVAEDRVMRGPLFRIVESSAAMRQALEEAEDGADAREPDSTHQTFRLANLHALARDLEGKLA